MGDNGKDAEQRMLHAVAETAVLLLRVGRDGTVILSGDAITMGDDVRAYGLLEKLKPAIGQICQERRQQMESRIEQPPPGLRLT